jgi:hypothetical protein
VDHVNQPALSSNEYIYSSKYFFPDELERVGLYIVVLTKEMDNIETNNLGVGSIFDSS